MAVEYLGSAESGRSNPMRCICEFDGAVRHEVYVKYSKFHVDLTLDHLAGELIANRFAVDLGLPAAQPTLVTVSEDFLSILPADADGKRIFDAFGGLAGVAFGSVAFSPVRRWSGDNLLHKGQLEEAVTLYLFDTLVENSDRGSGNPNLLVSGDNFKVIDFGHCFQRCHDGASYDDGPKPWQKGGILNHLAGNLQHVLYGGLDGVTDAMIASFTSRLDDLSDDIIQRYAEMVPAAWGQDTACKIVDYLLEARQNASGFGAKVREVLL